MEINEIVACGVCHLKLKFMGIIFLLFCRKFKIWMMAFGSNKLSGCNLV